MALDKDQMESHIKGLGGVPQEKLEKICDLIEQNYLSREQAAAIAGVKPDVLDEKCENYEDLDFKLEQAEAKAVRNITERLGNEEVEIKSAEERALGRLLEALNPKRFGKKGSGERGDITLVLDECPPPPEQTVEEIKAEEDET